MLLAAETAFATRGYFNVSMEDVASSCLLSRRTLYRYFPTKEALAAELTLQALQDLIELWDQVQASPHPSGLALVRALGESLGTFGFQTPYRYQSMRLRWFVGVSEQVKQQALSQIIALNKRLEGALVSALSQGIHDGSVRKDLDSNLTAVTMMGSSAGLLDSIVVFGPHYQKVYGVEPRQVWQTHLDFVEQGIRSSAC